MARYITPSKIALLQLLSLYCEDEIPSGATVSVLSFITSQLLPLDGATRIESQGLLALSDFKDVLNRSTAPYADVAAWERFVTCLWRIESLDSLFDFFENLQLLLEHGETVDAVGHPVKNPLRKASLMGAFVRRCSLDFQRLMFLDAVSIWREFEDFRLASSADFPEMRSISSEMNEDRSYNILDLQSSKELSTYLRSSRGVSETYKNPDASDNDINKLLEFQLERMQKTGTRMTQEMETYYKNELGLVAQYQTKSFYVKFLNAWYSRDHATAFEYLHRYYDNTMHSKERSHYQYALLNMAVMQADFGCFSEAITAIDETIATARENKDLACLNYCVSWLYHLRTIDSERFDDETRRRLITSYDECLIFLRSRAQETRMWAILSSTALNEAILSMSQGHGHLKAFECVLESSELNVKHDLKSIMANQLQVEASIYARLGLAHLSESYNRLVVSVPSYSIQLEDEVKMKCRLAHMRILRGGWDEAVSILKTIVEAENASLKLQDHLSHFIGLLKLKKALHTSDLDFAARLLPNLLSQPTSNPAMNHELQLLQLDFLRRRNDIPSAFEMVERMSESARKQDADIWQRIRILCAKATLFRYADKTEKGFTLAIRALMAAYQAKLGPAIWEATGVLAYVLIALEEYENALELLHSVVWQAMETEDLELLSMLYSALADGEIGIAGANQEDTKRRDSHCRQALGWVELALSAFTKLMDSDGKRNMLLKAITICNVLHEEDKRQSYGVALRKSLHT